MPSWPTGVWKQNSGASNYIVYFHFLLLKNGAASPPQSPNSKPLQTLTWKNTIALFLDCAPPLTPAPLYQSLLSSWNDTFKMSDQVTPLSQISDEFPSHQSQSAWGPSWVSALISSSLIHHGLLHSSLTELLCPSNVQAHPYLRAFALAVPSDQSTWNPDFQQAQPPPPPPSVLV